MAAPTVQSTPNCTKEAWIEKAATARNQLVDVAASVLGARFVDPFLRAMTVVE